MPINHVWDKFMLTVLLVTVAVAQAEDFRVETKVFRQGQSEPVSSNLTLFWHGTVYDYLSDSDEVTVMEPRNRRVRILSTSTSMQTVIPFETLDSFVHQLRAWAAQHEDPFLRFSAEPEFQIKDHEEVLSFSHEYLNYRLLLATPPQEEASRQWREFSDCYAKLNAILRPGPVPPFPRLLVNNETAAHGAVTREVWLNIPIRRLVGDEEVALRIEHKFFWRILDGDKRRIRRTHEQLADLSTVSLAEYRKSIAAAPASPPDAVK